MNRTTAYQRPKMTEREGFAAFVLRMRTIGLHDPRLFAAIESVQRQNFIDVNLADLAYSSRTIPLSCGEYIESLDEQARILSALHIEENHRVLEIGTGSGFTAAVMGRLAARVTSLDRYRTLCENARSCIQALKLENINIKHADGRHGAAGGPFDRIVSWVAFEDLPKHYIDLLATHGVLIAPVGPGDGVQMMSKLSKVGSRFEQEDLLQVRYQPFIDGLSSVL